MTRDLETVLAESLRERAPIGVVDTSELLIRARARGRRLHRRREAYAGAVIAVAAAVIAVAIGVGAALSSVIFGRPEAGVGASGGGERDGVVAVPAGSPAGPYEVPALPVADRVPGAAANPKLVGSDPNLLHFAIEGMATRFAGAEWRSQAGLEVVQLARTPSLFSWVTLASNSMLLEKEIRGRTGSFADSGDNRAQPVGDRRGLLWTFPAAEGVSYLVQWQPVDGLWVNVHVRAGTLEDLWDLVERVRLDTAQRCVAPVGVTTRPPGARLVSCRTHLLGYPERRNGATMPRFGAATLVFDNGRGNSVRVEARPCAEHDRSLPANRAVNGRKAYYEPEAGVAEGGERVEALTLPDANGVRVEIWTPGAYGEKEATLIGAGLVLTDELDRPERWPIPTP